ncbi:MAG: glucokinase [Alphaproteobacteria bacterium]
MMVLCDIGGTYVRFAIAAGGAPAQIEKYKAADYPNLQSALNAYVTAHNIKCDTLRIATAGYDDNGIWKFVNQNTWHIDPAAIGMVDLILNDFEAATWSLLRDDGQKILKQGEGASGSKCLIGAGTGLGLGYLHQTPDGPYVQKTHGGHILAAGLNDEHAGVIKTLRERHDTALVFENIVSGPGLQTLRKHYDEATALRLFHEFLGFFAATVTVTGNAYGGLYLTGGVIESLMHDDLFAFEIFEAAFCMNVAASVKRDLNATPIIYLTDPYPALKGLLHA